MTPTREEAEKFLREHAAFFVVGTQDVVGETAIPSSVFDAGKKYAFAILEVE